MSTPPWGHKPPAVDPYAYWIEPPPSPSDRLIYWLRRIVEGTWVPNRHLRMEGYDNAAHHMGVYMWEYLHVLYPVYRELDQS